MLASFLSFAKTIQTVHVKVICSVMVFLQRLKQPWKVLDCCVISVFTIHYHQWVGLLATLSIKTRYSSCVCNFLAVKLHIHCGMRVVLLKLTYFLYFQWKLKPISVVLILVRLHQANSFSMILNLFMMQCCHYCPFKALFIVIFWIYHCLFLCYLATLYKSYLVLTLTYKSWPAGAWFNSG